MLQNKILYGDCLDLMPNILKNSIDLIVADLPFGFTANKWDEIIPFKKLWAEYNRILKPNGTIILNSAGKFTAMAIMSNIGMFKYDIIWRKSNATGHLNAKKQPLRAHESILIFYNTNPTFNPQKTYNHTRKVSNAKHVINNNNYRKYGANNYDSTERYPTSVLDFKSDKQKSKLHPTQKPLTLVEYLILTYSNPGNVILDNCSGSGTTAIACINTNRKYIIMEKDLAIYNIGKDRIYKHLLGDMY